MQLESNGFFHLAYCTNIHPGNGWDEVFENLQAYAPQLKARLAPEQPFALGLRLSALESEQLLAGGRLEAFKNFLADENLYVCLINGFVFGSFHKTVVKESVFAPDWQTGERVDYTLRLVEILRQLLPEHLDGGISTLPLSYKKWVNADDNAVWEKITENIVQVVEALVKVRQAENRLIHLDIEPEPDGLVETSAELASFYQNWLLPVGGKMLADRLPTTIEEARRLLLNHVQVCLDTCHFAVEYEDFRAALERFERVGIGIGRVQISSALKIELPDEPHRRTELAAQLESFAESCYLHQVVEQKHDGTRRQYSDLAKALPMIHEKSAKQWRVHFHVPLFVERYAAFGSTQTDIRRVFELLGEKRFTRHLEIETYTWDVLPPNLKLDLVESICREHNWVRDELSKLNYA